MWLPAGSVNVLYENIIAPEQERLRAMKGLP